MTAENQSSYDRDATIDVGISLAHDLSLNQAVAAASGTGSEDGGGLGGGLCYLNSPVRLAAFGVYWDVSTGQLAMVDPLVIGPKGTIICGLPDGISNGTYYCNVTHDTKTDTYTAQIENKEAGAEDGTESVASVMLFTLSDDEFTQHHMGAIILTGVDAGNYVAGDDTNIVFSKKKDSEGNATGEIAVDVYYK